MYQSGCNNRLVSGCHHDSTKSLLRLEIFLHRSNVAWNVRTASAILVTIDRGNCSKAKIDRDGVHLQCRGEQRTDNLSNKSPPPPKYRHILCRRTILKEQLLIFPSVAKNQHIVREKDFRFGRIHQYKWRNEDS